MHEPAAQVSEPKQPMQTRPAVPQACGVVPATHSPLMSQQPVAQVLGPQVTLPPPVPPPALPPPVGLAQTPP